MKNVFQKAAIRLLGLDTKSNSHWRKDGWENPLTGFGTSRDKLTAAHHARSCQLSQYEVLSLFTGDDVAAKIVSFRPKEMFRRGYRLESRPLASDQAQDDLDEAESTDTARLLNYGTKLNVDAKVKETMIWGRLFGGALLIAGLDDGRMMSAPLDEKNIRSVKYLNVVDMRDITILSYFEDPLDPQYNEPELYEIYSSIGASFVIHSSRVLKFEGEPVDSRTRRELKGWTYSVLQRPYDRLRSFGTSFQAVSNLLADLSQGVFKINGLMDILSSGETGKLDARMQLADMTRSTSRALVLDAELEDFDRIATPLSGLPETLDRVMMCTSACANIPVSILFGRSAGGLNATGDMDFRAFYDTVESEQKSDLKPQLLKLYRWFALAKDSGVAVDPETLDIDFFPLWQPSEKEQAECRWLMAQADNAYIMNAGLAPEEAVLSRFGAGKFSMETTIDVKGRKDALKKAESFDPHENDPEPPTEQTMQPGQKPTVKGGDKTQARPSNASKSR